jgi:hypothetical protein
VDVGQLAHELTGAALLGLRDVLAERARLLERVKEAAVAQRHEQARPDDSFLQRLPLLLGEIRFPGP